VTGGQLLTDERSANSWRAAATAASDAVVSTAAAATA